MKKTINQQLLTHPKPLNEPAEGSIGISPRLKRAESDSNDASGRTFDEHTSPQLKHESSPETIAQDSPASPKGKARGRVPHNQVERKYRETLNSQLESLRRVVPALQEKPRGQSPSSNPDIEDLPVPSKPSKAVILSSATAYIRQVEKQKKQAEDENLLLRKRIKALQALVKCDDCSLMQYVMDLKLGNGI